MGLDGDRDRSLCRLQDKRPGTKKAAADRRAASLLGDCSTGHSEHHSSWAVDGSPAPPCLTQPFPSLRPLHCGCVPHLGCDSSLQTPLLPVSPLGSEILTRESGLRFCFHLPLSLLKPCGSIPPPTAKPQLLRLNFGAP